MAGADTVGWRYTKMLTGLSSKRQWETDNLARGQYGFSRLYPLPMIAIVPGNCRTTELSLSLSLYRYQDLVEINERLNAEREAITESPETAGTY